jgi:hypothetical protein
VSLQIRLNFVPQKGQSPLHLTSQGWIVPRRLAQSPSFRGGTTIHPGSGTATDALHAGPLCLSRLGHQPPADPVGVWRSDDAQAAMEVPIRELCEHYALRKNPYAFISS